MKHWMIAVVCIGCLAISAFGAGKGPEIVFVDNRFSITAEAIPLGRLLRLLDQATGMTSRVPAELANRNLSVRFSGLPFEEGVRKMFQGQPFDYVFVQGKGIIVTAASQTISTPDSSPPPVFNQPPGQVEQPNGDDNEPFVPQPIQPVPQPAIVPGGGFGVMPGNPGNPQVQQQPAVIQTPFGPIANPRANQPVQPNGSVNGQPFGAMTPFFAPTAPLGGTNPNGQNQNQNQLFGGSSPAFNPGQTNPQPLFGAQPGQNGQQPHNP